MNFLEIKYLFLIIIIFIAACLETDIYLPAFPDMMAYFSVAEEEIQRLLSWNFIGICISGPFYGPLSDAFGRKTPLLIALGIFFWGSMMTVSSDSFDVILWGRLLQGIGSGGCFTLGTAIIFDAFKGGNAVKALTRINSIIPFIMAGAPMLGGFLNQTYGFRSNFLAIAFCVMVCLLITLFFFEETLNEEKRSKLEMKKILQDFKTVCTNIPFWLLTIAVSLMFAGLMAFLSGIAILYVLEFGVSKEAFPYYQGSILASWLIASLSYGRALAKWKPLQIKMTGLTLMTFGGMAFIGGSYLFPKMPALFTVCMVFYTFGINWVQGLYFPEGMEILPEIKGITASVLTSFRLLITAIIIETTGYFYNASIDPLAFMVMGIIFTVLPLLLFYERYYGGKDLSTSPCSAHL